MNGRRVVRWPLFTASTTGGVDPMMTINGPINSFTSISSPVNYRRLRCWNGFGVITKVVTTMDDTVYTFTISIQKVGGIRFGFHNGRLSLMEIQIDDVLISNEEGRFKVSQIDHPNTDKA